MSAPSDVPNLPAQVLAERFHLHIPSSPAWIGPTVDYLQQKALLAGACSENRARKLTVALHEALSNAVVHGNLGISSELKEREDEAFAQALAERAGDPALASLPVDIVVEYDGERCQWTITDQGQGFDVSRVLRRCLADEPDVQLASGRGILMMHSFLDEVRYEIGGRRVVLTLRLPAGPERRCALRAPAHVPLQVAPLRPDGTPDWQAAYAAVSRDVSTEGVALWQEGLAPSERILIGIARGTQVTYVAAEVRHVRPVGDGSIELGCRFLPGSGAAEAPQASPVHLQEVHEAVAVLLEQPRVPLPSDERRTHGRLAFTERIGILFAGQFEPIVAFSRDLSKGGIAFITRMRLPAEITIILSPAGHRPPLRIQARVLRCDRVAEGFYDVGAQFARLASAERSP
jgi:anti-sigma regulatory factor (Ser/Thr protein kinase)